jgi:micrococcal nuclease
LQVIGFHHVAALVAALTIAPAHAAEGWIARDGDTIVAPWREVIRIANIDTAEMNCRCAAECTLAYQAKAATAHALWLGSQVTLVPYTRPRDRYGRTLAYVVIDGRDLGKWLIGQGLARPYDGGRRDSWCRPS